MTEYAINRDTIAANYNRLRNHIRRTPVLVMNGRDFALDGFELHLKLESLQYTGSFKARGALTHFLLGSVPQAGVVAASGGNHGAAVAFAAHQFALPAAIFVPEIASAAKRARITDFGGDLHVVAGEYADALKAAEDYRAGSGAKNIHAYDQPETIVGQGSLTLEFQAQSPGLTTILIAIGGGGLIAGAAAWTQGGVRLIGVEPENCPTAKRALETGRPTDVSVSGIAADALGARRIGALAFPLIQTFVEDIVTVNDRDIAKAQQMLWQQARIVAEPAGATALAALLSGAHSPSEDERVGIVICGANTTAVDFGPLPAQ